MPFAGAGFEAPDSRATASQSGNCIVSGSEDKTLIVWDAKSGKPLATLRGQTDSVTSVAISPDGKRIVSGSKGVLKVWNFKPQSNGRFCPFERSRQRD